MTPSPIVPSRYARPELERRFLFAEPPSGLEHPAWITDRYLDGTRLRLRRVENDDGTVVRKLGQKIRARPTDPTEVWLTNLYLDENEYGVLSALPGADLSKTRHRWPAST